MQPQRWWNWRSPWGGSLWMTAAGALGAGGFAPWSQPLLLAVALGLLLVLLREAGWRRGLGLGFVFGVGHFIPAFSWLITSLHVHGHIPLPTSWLILTGLAAAMAVHTALFGLLYVLWAPPGWAGLLAAPALWAACEWLRTVLFSGFPWNLAGYAWTPWLEVLQVADLGGVILLSTLTMALGALWAAALSDPGGWRRRGLLLGGAVGLLALAHGYGAWRLAALDALPPSGDPPLAVGLVQGNIPQELKWQKGYNGPTLKIYEELTRRLPGPLDLVVWPETALPFFLEIYGVHRHQMGALVQQAGAPILTGVPLLRPVTGDPSGRSWDFFNGALLLNEQGDTGRRYEKHHLVPYGEYVPLRWLLPGTIQKLTPGGQDFTPGPGPVPLAWDKGALGILICYETIFPDEVRTLARAGARWLVNLTNDGWFGPSAKPQHLAMAQMRAVENRLPMIRVANTGISAAFDHRGRELIRIPALARDAVRVLVPPGTGESLFRRIGMAWLGPLFLAALAASWWLRWRQGRLPGMPDTSG
ncbi:MAG: apolipoprotein N-acyltransferase [Magnetococcales bacterium]|nr:apolipoprotein N-acyltransferase [Magnetococcales bacterium]